MIFYKIWFVYLMFSYLPWCVPDFILVCMWHFPNRKINFYYALCSFSIKLLSSFLIYTYIHIYIYIERERQTETETETERDREREPVFTDFLHNIGVVWRQVVLQLLQFISTTLWPFCLRYFELFFATGLC